MKSVFQNLTLFTLILTPQIHPQSWWQQHGQTILNCSFGIGFICLGYKVKNLTQENSNLKQKAQADRQLSSGYNEVKALAESQKQQIELLKTQSVEFKESLQKIKDILASQSAAPKLENAETKKNNLSTKSKKTNSKNDSDILNSVKQIVSDAENTVKKATETSNLLSKILADWETRILKLEIQSQKNQQTLAKHHALHFLTGQIILGQNRYPAFPNHHAMHLANKGNYTPKLKDAKEQELFKNYCNFLNILSTQVPEKLAESLD